MAIQNSYLGQTGYGYDTVVAISQNALNDVIKQFYFNNKTSFDNLTIGYVWRQQDDGTYAPGIMTPNDYRDLPVDPLAVDSWDGTGTMPDQVSAIVNSKVNFAFAFNFTVGDPTGLGLSGISYLALNPGEQTALYYLLCQQIQIAFWNPDNKSWINVTQSPTNKFNINATINLQNIINNNNLTPNVQSLVNELGPDNVNVQQLIFDFDSAVVNPTSSLPGLDSSCSIFTPMMKVFQFCYFTKYQQVAAPVLNYSITAKNPSTLQPTSMDFFADALVDANGIVISNPDGCQQKLATLNYLFAVENHSLPAGKQITWNWLENNGTPSSPTAPLCTAPNADMNIYDGAIAIKRDVLAQYFYDQLNGYVNKNCYEAVVIGENYGMFDVTFFQSVPNGGLQPYLPNSYGGFPDKLLEYEFYSEVRQPGSSYEGDYLEIDTLFTFLLSIEDSQSLVVSQSIQFKVGAQINNQGYGGAPVVKSSYDVFDIVIGADGAINLQKDTSRSTFSDTSMPVSMPGDSFINNYINEIVYATFDDVPFTMPKQFVFPGGNAFSFSDAQFSRHGDLVCHVKYQAE